MGFDLTTFLAQIVNLFLLIWLLKHFLYQPVLQMIDKRRQHIIETIQEAESKLSEAQQVEDSLKLQEYEFDISYQKRLQAMDSELTQQKAQFTQQLSDEFEQRYQDMQNSLNRSWQMSENTIQQMIADEFISLTQKVLSEWSEQTSMDYVIALFDKKISSLSSKQKTNLKNLLYSLNTVQFITHEKLTKQQQESVRQIVQKHFEINPKMRFQFKANPELLLGIEMHLGDFILQWSLNTYLQEVNQRLKQNISGMILPSQRKDEK